MEIRNSFTLVSLVSDITEICKFGMFCILNRMHTFGIFVCLFCWYQPRIPLLAGMYTWITHFATTCGYPEVLILVNLVK